MDAEAYPEAKVEMPPGEFDCPFGVAVAHGRLYVSERRGQRIQVLSLDGEPLQVIESPDGRPLGRLCVDGENLWVLGPHEDPTYGHIFAPYFPDPKIAAAGRRAPAEMAKIPHHERNAHWVEAARQKGEFERRKRDSLLCKFAST